MAPVKSGAARRCTPGRCSFSRPAAFLFGLLAGVIVLAAVPPSRHLVLRSLGRLLIVADDFTDADIAVMTTDEGPVGALEVADLFHQRLVQRVGVLIPRGTLAVGELARRGVHISDNADVLTQLGVPAASIARIAAGEGGTNEGTGALAAWCADNHIRRLVVVTSSDHSRRVRRTLLRSFGRNRPIVFIHSSRFSQFRPDDWWRSRTTLRTGIMELEKLAFDYVRHPLG